MSRAARDFGNSKIYKNTNDYNDDIQIYWFNL